MQLMSRDMLPLMCAAEIPPRGTLRVQMATPDKKTCMQFTFFYKVCWFAFKVLLKRSVSQERISERKWKAAASFKKAKFC